MGSCPSSLTATVLHHCQVALANPPSVIAVARSYRQSYPRPGLRQGYLSELLCVRDRNLYVPGGHVRIPVGGRNGHFVYVVLVGVRRLLEVGRGFELELAIRTHRSVNLLLSAPLIPRVRIGSRPALSLLSLRVVRHIGRTAMPISPPIRCQSLVVYPGHVERHGSSWCWQR